MVFDIKKIMANRHNVDRISKERHDKEIEEYKLGLVKPRIIGSRQEYSSESESDEEEKPKRGRPKKGNIMKARSDIRIKDGKRTLDTEMNIKKGLSTKDKKTLKSSIDAEFDRKIKGGGIRNSRPVKIDLDSSDSDY
jgi:hypothetical protein